MRGTSAFVAMESCIWQELGSLSFPPFARIGADRSASRSPGVSRRLQANAGMEVYHHGPDLDFVIPGRARTYRH